MRLCAVRAWGQRAPHQHAGRAAGPAHKEAKTPIPTARLWADDHHDYHTLADLIDLWDRGEFTLDEILKRWPHPDAPRDELLRELLTPPSSCAYAFPRSMD